MLSIVACGGSSGEVSTSPPPTAPTIRSNAPLNGATDVPINASVSASFSEAMDSSTLNSSTFTLTSGATAVPIQGTVVYANSTAVFWPAAHLASDTTFTATITTGVKNASGVALPANQAWSITTGKNKAPGLPVSLGTAGNFVILAKSGISTVPTSAITGNIGVSPIAATAITGFSLIADSTNVFSTSTQVVGKVYAADYAPPTPSNMTTAVGDMQLAFTDAAGRAPDVTELGAGNIGGMTLAPGVYKWGTGLLIPTNVTLSGSATDVWIFEIAQNMTMANGTNIFLAGGALPKNVFWQVSGAVNIGTTAHCEGVILSQTLIALKTGASINGRLLAQTAVTLDSSTVTDSGNSAMPTVLSNTPLNGAIGVPSNGSVSATFSEAMDPTTFTASTFTLTSGPGATPVQGMVSYANSKAVFLPATPLASNTTFTATITTEAKSASRVALAANHAWSFTTDVGNSTTPTILSNTPLNGATGVPSNEVISATFSEAMDHSTLTASTFTLTSGPGATPVQGMVSYANSVATFLPNTQLASSTTFTATITTGAKSAFGVALAANRAWSFTTVGVNPTPTVLSNTPLSGATGVLSNGIISANFSEAMDSTTLTASTFTLTSGPGATPVQGMVAYANTTATFLPATQLASNTSFTATITNGAKSTFGVALAANHAWSFTTGGVNPTPTVLSNTPLSGATGVLSNGIISANFSEAMDPASLTTGTFTLTSIAGPVLGSVNYANLKAVFNPTTQLASSTLYTATVKTGAKSALGVALAANYNWSFSTGNNNAPGVPVNLGTAGNFVILAKSGISTVPTSAITGNIGVSPAAATYITGFALTADASNVFSTSSQITGKVYAANYAPPTPSNMTTAVGDMELAFTDAASRAPDFTELGAGNIGGMTLVPGVYKWGTSVLIPTNVTLTGSATDVWIFEIAQNMTMANATNIFLAGGALSKNVFWQVSGAVTIGTTAHCEGIILSQTAIALRTGASINGRLLAQTAVTLDSSTVVQPAP